MATGTKVTGFGTLALIATFILIGVTSNEPTHACYEDETKTYCDHLSSTKRTCYPYSNTRIGSKLCSGVWEEIPELLINDHLKRIHCTSEGCIGG